MKKSTLIALLTSTLISAALSVSAHSADIATSVFTSQLFGDTYRDRDTNEEKNYNSSARSLSLWLDMDVADIEQPFEAGTQVKYGLSAFEDSFDESGYAIGLLIEPRLSTYSIAGLGSFETYYGFGVNLSSAHQQMNFLPVPLSHIGIRTKNFFANVGAVGLSPAVTGNIGISF